ncbi:MAG: hypothetical protein QOJ31_1311 [Gaiellales bacterium]|jgi:hypothetical protein|nr:hypothetical protein [Gaiellales bacterium]MDX6545221.1 hypothetical protein [Gaiellales bacterium]MDX6550627.1 hypothetical protein [Gaiellales bacterium]
MIRRALILALTLISLTTALAQAAGGGDYLASRQTLSGGFAEAGGSASVSLTEWSVMGLQAAGRSPATMHRPGGKTPVAFLAAQAKNWHDSYSLERGILAAVALGANPTRFAGRNLVTALRSTVNAATGRIGSFSNSTYWGVLAFRAAAATLPTRSLAYIRSQQGAGGGYGYAPGTGADSNDTAAAVMALRSGGTPCNVTAVAHAYDFMHSLQRSDHGYALNASAGSDSQSTSWVIQARIKCGLINTGALGYLTARKRTSGAYEYRAGLLQTPAWVTAQVLPAVHGKAYPIR